MPGATTLFWPWGGILLWPAAACVLVTAAYFGLGPGIYRKIGGRLTLSTKLLFAPFLFGQYLSLLYYRRQCRSWNELTPQIWIGRKLSDVEAREAVRQGVTAVLDLTAEFSEARPFRELRYLNVPILDLTAPTAEQIEQCLEFLAENAAEVVYIHCKIGYSRTAAVAGAYLIAAGKASTAVEAERLLRSSAPRSSFAPKLPPR